MTTDKILGVVLAGGTSRRFGVDKRGALLAGRSVLEWVIERARPQVETLLLNTIDDLTAAGRPNIERIADHAPGEGPLAGILAGLDEADHRGFSHMVSFACDTPFFPDDTVSHLVASLKASVADYAVASCGARAHRIFALWPTGSRKQVEHAFANGTRSMRDIEHWLETTWADFPKGGGPDGDPFFNINTPADLEIAEQWLVAQSAAAK
jgi:molybdopterin-guanine dinucleotide biosynthesis protein A